MTLTESLFRRRIAFLLALVFILIAAATIWKIGSPKWYGRFLYEDASPDGRYRVQTWRAYYFTSNDYGFARLYDNRTGGLMCESGVQWLTGNGQIHWLQSQFNRISVGIDIHFILSADGRSCTVMP